MNAEAERQAKRIENTILRHKGLLAEKIGRQILDDYAKGKLRAIDMYLYRQSIVHPLGISDTPETKEMLRLYDEASTALYGKKTLGLGFQHT